VSIVSSEIVGNVLLADGRRQVTERHVDHVGAVHDVYYVAPVGADLGANLTARATALEASLADAEDNQALGLVGAEADVVALCLNPVHSTSKRLAKRLIYWLIRARRSDNLPEILRLLLPLVDYLKANYNPSQLSSFLDLSLAQLSQMDTKIGYLRTVQGVSPLDALALAEAESEDLDG